MNRSMMTAMIAVGLVTLPAISFADTVPAAAPLQTAEALPQQSAAVDAYMQGLIQKCLDNGVLLPDQVQGMTDAELNVALTNCANTLRMAQPAAVPAPTVVRSAPVVVQEAEPVVVRRRQRVVVNEAPAIVEQAPAQFNIGNNSGNNSGNGNVIGGLADALGGLGNLSGGGDLGAGGGDGGAEVPVPVVNGLDARIAGLESGIKEGINTSALTQNEAAFLQFRLGRIQAQRANLGDTPANRLALQQQVDQAVSEFNQAAHNNSGIPNPDLFRSFKRKGATAGLNGQTLSGQQPGGRFAALRARLAAAKNGQAVTTGSVKNDRFAAIRARIAAAKNGQLQANVGTAGSSRIAKYLERRRQQAKLSSTGNTRCFRAPCNISGPVATTNTGNSFKNRFVQRRIAQIRQANANKVTTTTSRKSVVARQIFQRRAASASAGSRTNKLKSFMARRIASR